jgi:hypothetical protein
VQRWLNSGSLTCPSGQSAGSGSNVISKNIYFDTGTVQTSADPCGNTTTFTYSTTFWGALPTQITNPLSQPTLHNYDFNTGLTLSTTDPNLLVTSYSYDSMMRLLQANYPDGGLETVSYQESAYPFTATTTKKINTTQTESKTVVYDGLGRVTETQLTSDPQGTIYTDTTYDAEGRVATVSNPYRKGTDATTSSGITTDAYDALSRKISETYAGGSVLQTAYCGPFTLVTALSANGAAAAPTASAASSRSMNPTPSALQLSPRAAPAPASPSGSRPTQTTRSAILRKPSRTVRTPAPSLTIPFPVCSPRTIRKLVPSLTPTIPMALFSPRRTLATSPPLRLTTLSIAKKLAPIPMVIRRSPSITTSPTALVSQPA